MIFINYPKLTGQKNETLRGLETAASMFGSIPPQGGTPTFTSIGRKKNVHR